MTANSLPLIAVLLCLIAAALIADPSINDLQKDVKKLKDDLSKCQQKEDVPYKFPFQWQRQKGLYDSEVKLNFMDQKGSWEETELRRLFQIPDLNMFVTNFVLLSQIDSHDLDDLKLNAAEFDMAIQAILSYHDKNYPKGIPIYKFWPTISVNGTWEAYPPNLSEPLRHVDSMATFITALLRTIHMEHWAEKIGGAVKALETLAHAFHIPPDTDDSFCNMALGAFLYEHRALFPNSYNLWQQQNTDYKSFLEIVKKYAYRPFQNYQKSNSNKILNVKGPIPGDTDADFMDPRVYYLIHDFLQKELKNAEKNGQVPNLILPTTWLMNLEDDLKKFPKVAMPFHSNNIDLSVASNVLFGLTKHVLTFPEGQLLFDEEIQKMYKDTVNLLAYMIESKKVFDRPDIALVYYPSLFDFVWFVGRIYKTLCDYEQQTKRVLPFQVMREAKSTLEFTLKKDLFPYLLNEMDIDHSKRIAFFDDFLGDYAGKHYGEDRIFSTGLVVNAFLDVYTVKINSTKCRRQWSADTPAEIKTATQFMINFLHEETFKFRAHLMNAFFSGSVKGMPGLPFWYPQNFNYFTNGTKMPNTDNMSLATDKAVCSVKGVVDDDLFKNVFLKKKWFGQPVPTEFDHYEDIFPFWSSKSMTYSTVLLAIAKFIAVSTCTI